MDGSRTFRQGVRVCLCLCVIGPVKPFIGVKLRLFTFPSVWTWVLCFGCGSFEYQQHMLRLRNIYFQLRTLISGPGVCVCVWGGGGLTSFFCLFAVINVFHRGPYGPPSRSKRTPSRGVSVPVFLGKHLAIWDFPGGGVGWGRVGWRSGPPAPSGSAYAGCMQWFYYLFYFVNHWFMLFSFRSYMTLKFIVLSLRLYA